MRPYIHYIFYKTKRQANLPPPLDRKSPNQYFAEYFNNKSVTDVWQTNNNEKRCLLPEGLTFPKFWLILLVEVDASTSLLKFEISRRVGNWSLRRSENSRIFSLSFVAIFQITRIIFAGGVDIPQVLAYTVSGSWCINITSKIRDFQTGGQLEPS